MNTISKRLVVCSLAILVFSGCTSYAPIRPRVAVMPAPNKPFEVFAEEEQLCRQYADQSIGVAPEAAASKSFAESAVAGAAIGTAAGVLLGGRNGAPVGAGMGLIAGSVAGSNQAAYSSRDAQWRYDLAYQQCMYAKGNQIPGYLPQQWLAPPPARYGAPNIPPPPPK